MEELALLEITNLLFFGLVSISIIAIVLVIIILVLLHR